MQPNKNCFIYPDRERGVFHAPLFCSDNRLSLYADVMQSGVRSEKVKQSVTLPLTVNQRLQALLLQHQDKQKEKAGQTKSRPELKP